jgi:MFS family permease
MKEMFRAFASCNYRLYFAGQLVSLIGTWMTQTASLWIIYKLSHSTWILGVAGFCSLAPAFFLGPVAGVWVDRVNRYRLLLFTQVLAMGQSFALAYFTLNGTIDILHLLLLNLFQGLINAFDLPARQALVVEFVGKKEHLGNAIALNSSLFNLSRLVGPALAGFAIAAWGAGICFLLDGASYLAVIGCLLAMRLPKREKIRPSGHPLHQLREGFHYVWQHEPIRALLGLVAMISFWGFAFAVLAPYFARDVFKGDARTLGFLMMASGLGALLGALYLSTRRDIKGLGLVMVGGTVLQGCGLIAVSWATWLPAALACLVATGMGGVLIIAASNTVVQTLVTDDKRGRVMSFFTMAFMGTMPVGNLAIGALAQRWGAVSTLQISGLGCLIAGLLFYRKLPRLREAMRVRRLEEAKTDLTAS